MQAPERSSERFDGHTGLVSCVSFLPDGKTCGLEQPGQDDPALEPEHRQASPPVRWPSAEVIWVAVSPDGRHLLSSDYNAHELRLWDLTTREQIDRIDLGQLSPDPRNVQPRWSPRGMARDRRIVACL